MGGKVEGSSVHTNASLTPALSVTTRAVLTRTMMEI